MRLANPVPAGVATVLAACALLLAAAPALGQADTIVVCNGTCLDPPLGAQSFTDINLAFQEALANANIKTVQIFESGSPWQLNPIPQINRAGFTIEGIGAPETVVVQSASPQVFEIAATGVLIQGLTIEGSGPATPGQNVIRVLSGADVVINRAYITNGDDHGVYVMNGGTATFVNSVAIGNGADGVHTEGDANIQFSTFKDNGDDGIEVAGGTATVKNNIIALNGAVGLNVSAGTATEDFNNVWMNSGGDYAGVAPGANSIVPGVDPFFEPAGTRDWDGQIAGADAVANPNPVTDVAETPADGTVSAFAFEDFDGEPRPTDNPVTGLGVRNDMGADEVNLGGNVSTWTNAQVLPDPVGAVAIGQLRVQLTISNFGGIFATDNFGGATTKVVLVPELVDGVETLTQIIADDGEGVDAITIPIAITFISGNTYVGTNAVPIPMGDTQLENGDTVFDGRARVVVIEGGTEVDPLPGSPAEDNRFFVIDTLPPRIAGIPAPPAGVTADFFVTGHNDTAMTNVPGFSVDDGVPGFQTNGAQISTTLIRQISGGEGAKIFFNVGALDEPAGRDLEFTVELTVIDEAPATTPPISTVGGFDAALGGVVDSISITELEAGSVVYPQMPRWRRTGDSDMFRTSSGRVEVEFITNNINATTGRAGELTVIWRFANPPADPVGSSTGNHALQFSEYFGNAIDSQLETDAVHWGIQFVPVDGSGLPAPDDTLLDPLHIWWQLRPQTDLGPTMDRPVARPQFFWDLRRPDDPGDSGELNPQFAIRFLESVHATQGSVEAKAGPYRPVSVTVPGLNANGWSNWSFQSPLTFNGFFAELTQPPTDLSNRWLLLVVLGVDEAGNVELWPSDAPNSGMLQIAPNTYQLNQGSGLNWERFFIDAQPDIETELIGTFWHDQTPFSGTRDPNESTFENARVIPLPAQPFFDFTANPANFQQNVAFEFTVTAVSEIGDTRLRVRLRGEGFDDELFFPGPVATVRSSDFDIPNPPGRLLGDPTRRDPRTYVFEAATQIDTDMNGTFDDEDTTPVNYFFAVVPDVAEYIENRTSPDFQPIKSVETN